MKNNPKAFLTCLVLFLILAILSFFKLQFSELYFHSPDEFAFHGSLERIYKGLSELDLRSLFGTGFFSYGFLYFFTVFLPTAPFFLSDNLELTIFVPRLYSAFFACLGLFFLYKILLFYVRESMAYLSLFILILMPSFWFNSLIFHPDWPYTSLIIISVYFLIKDNWTAGRNFWLAVFFYALAFSIKIQAITFIPIFALYALKTDDQRLKSQIWLITKAGLLIFGIRLLTNPYLLHPEGFKAFTAGFMSDMNANKEGAMGVTSFWDKLDMMETYYYHKIILVPLSLLVIYYSTQFFNKKNKSVVAILSIVIMVNMAYLLLFVNKNWQHYYLTLFATSIVIIPVFLSRFNKRYATVLVALILIIQFGTHWNSYKSNIVEYVFEEEAELKQFTDVDDLLESRVNNETNILISGRASFEFEKIDLSYNNIFYTWGRLGPQHLTLEGYLTENPNNKSADYIEKDFILLSKVKKDSIILMRELELVSPIFRPIGKGASFVLLERRP